MQPNLVLSALSFPALSVSPVGGADGEVAAAFAGLVAAATAQPPLAVPGKKLPGATDARGAAKISDLIAPTPEEIASEPASPTMIVAASPPPLPGREGSGVGPVQVVRLPKELPLPYDPASTHLQPLASREGSKKVDGALDERKREPVLVAALPIVAPIPVIPPDGEPAAPAVQPAIASAHPAQPAPVETSKLTIPDTRPLPGVGQGDAPTTPLPTPTRPTRTRQATGASDRPTAPATTQLLRARGNVAFAEAIAPQPAPPAGPPQPAPVTVPRLAIDPLTRRPRAASPEAAAAPIASALAALPEPTATPPASAIEATPLDVADDQWMTAMIDRIETLRDAGGQRETRIRLTPDALGAVEVRLVEGDQGMQVQLTADTPAARALLADAAPRLADMAQERGLRLGQQGDPAQGGHPQQPHRPEPLRANRAGPADAEHTDTDERIA